MRRLKYLEAIVIVSPTTHIDGTRLRLTLALRLFQVIWSVKGFLCKLFAKDKSIKQTTQNKHRDKCTSAVGAL